MAFQWQVTLPATFASESRTMARGGDNFPVSGGSIPPAGTNQDNEPMNVPLELEDFPQDRPNCGNCTRRGGPCARSEKQFPNGHIKNSQTGEICGIIYRCPNYTGRHTS